MSWNEFHQKIHFLSAAEGKLRKLDESTGLATEEPFQFDVSKNPTYNQQRYEALGEVITEHVYQLLIDLGMHKINVDAGDGTPTSFVFASKPDMSQSKKLLILIHGSGVVRAGQWSRSLIINHSLDHGTQIPYIKRAITLGYDVLVTNTNLHLKNSSSPSLHGNQVWRQVLQSMKNVEHFAIVAHSYGGIVTLDLAKEHADIFLKKCFAIGFTDSVHSSRGVSTKLLQRFQKIACNWVASSEPLDTPLKSSANDLPRRSAGHTKHEWTSWACIDALFAFFENNYKQVHSSDEL